MTTARAASTSALNGSRGRRVGIEPKIPGIRKGLDEARGGRDHRRVVGAQRERREDRAGERGPELGVPGDAADDGDGFGARLLRGLLRALDQRADDRALVARSEVRAPA